MKAQTPAQPATKLGSLFATALSKPVTALVVLALLLGFAKPVLLVLANLAPTLAGIALVAAVVVLASRWIKTKI